MNWSAVIWAGFIATTLSAAFFWLVRAVGWTEFSPTRQLGCLFFRDPRGPMTETVGFLLLLAAGSSVLPAIYGLLLARVGGPAWPAGAAIGAAHGLLTAALLPPIGTISACVRHGFMRPPGRMGLGWGWATPVALIVGLAIYGGLVGAILAGF